MEPTLNNILESQTLKWVFVGGKGGVGKTTVSCSLALRLAEQGKRILIISTDPAHNLSDAFDQKIGKDPTPINGVANLYAMESDPFEPREDMKDAISNFSFFSDLMDSMPAFNEIASFGTLLKLLESKSFDMVVFDTAPTGHTLKLLQSPKNMSKTVASLLKLKSQIGPLFGMLSNLFVSDGEFGDEGIFGFVEELQVKVENALAYFTNQEKTTFINVCISEFLSLYETERLIQELFILGINTKNIVVNQLILEQYASKVVDISGIMSCPICSRKASVQSKYLKEIDLLYEDFHVVKVPVLPNDIRGIDTLRIFGNLLFR